MEEEEEEQEEEEGVVGQGEVYCTILAVTC